MNLLLAIMEPFVLILLGLVLSRTKRFPRTVWESVEKLVYYVLFPPLLFESVALAELRVLDAGRFLLCGVASMTAGVLLSWLVSRAAPVDRLTDASTRQCGYRFNSYIGFALAYALYGKEGVALFALLVGVWVPISNALAVADLAAALQAEGRGASGILRSIFTNPLIVATLAGLVFNVGGIPVPGLAASVFRSLGSASLALALMAVGAGLKAEDLGRCRTMLTLGTMERLVALPAFSAAAGLAFGLSAREIGALLCFTALPTANSCYVLTVRMGGNGPAVAGLTTLQTVAALGTLPCWMWFAGTL